MKPWKPCTGCARLNQSSYCKGKTRPCRHIVLFPLTLLHHFIQLFTLVCGYFVCFPALLTAQLDSLDIPYPESGIAVGHQADLQKAIEALPLELQDEIVDIIASSRRLRESLPGGLIGMPPELRENIVDVMHLDPSEDTDVILDVVVFLHADGSRTVGTYPGHRPLSAGVRGRTSAGMVYLRAEDRHEVQQRSDAAQRTRKQATSQRTQLHWTPTSLSAWPSTVRA